ncbi:MAG TPA: porin [bacterium]|nr:porin [bacterium]
MKSHKKYRVLPALIFMGLAGATPVWVQARPEPGTPTPSVADDLKALLEEKESVELRLKALEEKTPVASPKIEPSGDSGQAVRDIVVPLQMGNEYFNDESRWLEFSDPSRSALFRFSGLLSAQFNLYPGSAGDSLLGGLPSGGIQEDFNGFLTSAKVEVGAEFGHFAGLSIGLQNEDINQGGSLFSVPVNIAIADAFLYLKFDPALVFTGGKFGTLLSLEALQTPSNQLFAEPSMVSDLVPGVDNGIMLSGQVDGMLDYGVEFSNGVQDNEEFYQGAATDKPGHPPTALAARVFAEPFKDSDDKGLKGLGLGVAAAWDNEARSTSNGVTTSPDNKPWSGILTSLGRNQFLLYNAYSGVVAQGDFYHWDPQFFYYNGPFGAQGEWVQSIQTVGYGGTHPAIQLVNTAWVLEASWVFGGEASYEGARVDKPFDLSTGDWGALEVAARIHQLAADPNSFETGRAFNNGSISIAKGAQLATAFGLGVNWWPNSHCKAQLDWEETDFSGGNVPLDSEDLFAFRVALLL